MSLGVAALSFGAVKISTIRWDTPRQIAAGRLPAGGPRLATAAPVQITSAAADRTLKAGATTLTVTPSLPAHVAQLASVPPLTVAAPPALSTPGSAGRPSSPSMLVFNDAGARTQDRNAPLAAGRDDVVGSVEDDLALPPAAIETLISQATLVVPEGKSRTIVLPISFGKPLAPEDDAAPVTMRWRFRGMRSRHSYFLPGPGGPSVGDAIGQISRTQNFLR